MEFIIPEALKERGGPQNSTKVQRLTPSSSTSQTSTTSALGLPSLPRLHINYLAFVKSVFPLYFYAVANLEGNRRALSWGQELARLIAFPLATFNLQSYRNLSMYVLNVLTH